jgi:hypothetical protein
MKDLQPFVMFSFQTVAISTVLTYVTTKSQPKQGITLATPSAKPHDLPL